MIFLVIPVLIAIAFISGYIFAGFQLTKRLVDSKELDFVDIQVNLLHLGDIVLQLDLSGYKKQENK